MLGMGAERMLVKEWTFALDDGPHTVKLYYSYFSSREIVEVDGVRLSDEYRLTVRSDYTFVIGENILRASVRIAGFGGIACELTVNGQKLDDLPSVSLLRPAATPESAILLKPASAASKESHDHLIRPANTEPESETMP